MAETLREFHDRAWAGLEPDLRDRILSASGEIVSEWPEGARASLRREIRADRERWATPYHFFVGMAIRNAIRECGVLDSELPTGNLDDYYVKAIELALGVE